MKKHDIKGGVPSDKCPTVGPAFSAQAAADYLNCSLRQVHYFEEQGRLPFFNISEKLRRTTQPLCDQLLHESLLASLENGEK
jgi:hypothetical protein